MIAGRGVAGYACGMVLSVVPIYIAEISPPKERGFIVGLQGMAIATGFAIANWIGYGGSFAVGDAQWRISLAMQAPAAVLLTVGAFFVPFSPRWRKTNPLETLPYGILTIEHHANFFQTMQLCRRTDTRKQRKV